MVHVNLNDCECVCQSANIIQETAQLITPIKIIEIGVIIIIIIMIIIVLIVGFKKLKKDDEDDFDEKGYY